MYFIRLAWPVAAALAARPVCGEHQQLCDDSLKRSTEVCTYGMNRYFELTLLTLQYSTVHPASSLAHYCKPLSPSTPYDHYAINISRTSSSHASSANIFAESQTFIQPSDLQGRRDDRLKGLCKLVDVNTRLAAIHLLLA